MDSEARNKMRGFINSIATKTTADIQPDIEVFTDWVYDLAYRKGWNHGYWRIDPDYTYQILNLRRKRK